MIWAGQEGPTNTSPKVSSSPESAGGRGARVRTTAPVSRPHVKPEELRGRGYLLTGTVVPRMWGLGNGPDATGITVRCPEVTRLWGWGWVLGGFQKQP